MTPVLPPRALSARVLSRTSKRLPPPASRRRLTSAFKWGPATAVSALFIATHHFTVKQKVRMPHPPPATLSSARSLTSHPGPDLFSRHSLTLIQSLLPLLTLKRHTHPRCHAFAPPPRPLVFARTLPPVRPRLAASSLSLSPSLSPSPLWTSSQNLQALSITSAMSPFDQGPRAG